MVKPLSLSIDTAREENQVTSPSSKTAILPEMIDLPGGTFMMGDDEGRSDEQPAHEVTVDPFAIAKCPVSVAEYALFIQFTDHDQPRDWMHAPFDEPNLPVCGVNWFDAVAYAEWLSELTGQRFHLPTEAQREFASRGGAESAYPWGDEALKSDGAFARGLNGPATGAPIAIGQKPPSNPDYPGPNSFGLWHMGDNVHEWCADWYDRKYYETSEQLNPRGPAETDRRAARGGSWRHDIKFCRCGARSSLAPDKRFMDFGFRLARSNSFEYVF